MSAATRQPALGSERSVQEIVRSDAIPTRAPLDREAYTFLGDDDIPFERYTSHAFFELEMRCVWERAWQCACRDEHVRVVKIFRGGIDQP